MAEKQPVYNDLFDIDAEKSVLGSMLISKEAVETSCGQLEAADFHEERHRTIFGAMQELYDDDKGVDTVTIADALGRDGLSKVGGIAYISELGIFMPTAANVQSYIDIVADNSKRRIMLKGLQDAARSLRTGGDDYADIAQGALDSAQSIGASGIDEPKDVFADAYKNFGKYKEKALSTGFTGIDGITDGLRRKDLIILAARPSIGKTTLAIDIATNFATDGRMVLYFTLESSTTAVAKRSLVFLSKVSEYDLKTMEVEDAKRLVGAYERLAESRLYIFEYVSSINQIRAACKKMHRKCKGLDLIVVDYLTLMDIPQSKNKNYSAEIGGITRKLKLLAKEMNAPLLLLSQLSRDIEKRSDPTPRMSDLRESGNIEQDADVVIFIERRQEQQDAKILVAKNRDGRVGVAHMTFDGEHYSFYDADIPEPD